MKRSIQILQLFCFILSLSALACAGVAKQCFDVVVPPSAPPQIKFGASELSSAIKGRLEAQISVGSHSSPKCVSIKVQVQDRQATVVVSSKPESFAIHKRS